MKRTGPFLWAAVGALLLPRPLEACATCFGRSDSALAQGLNMGILFLLGVLLVVLGGLVAFFVYLARRAAAFEAAAAAPAEAASGGYQLKEEFRPHDHRATPAVSRTGRSRFHARVHH